MVFSRIDKSINYTETNSVNTKDLEYGYEQAYLNYLKGDIAKNITV